MMQRIRWRWNRPAPCQRTDTRDERSVFEEGVSSCWKIASKFAPQMKCMQSRSTKPWETNAIRAGFLPSTLLQRQPLVQGPAPEGAPSRLVSRHVLLQTRVPHDVCRTLSACCELSIPVCVPKAAHVMGHNLDSVQASTTTVLSRTSVLNLR